MDQPYPEDVRICTACLFFAGNPVKLAQENACCLRGFREDIRTRSIRFCLDNGDELVLSPTSVLSIKMTENSTKRSIAFELCPITSIRIVEYLVGHAWNQFYRICSLIIDIESFCIGEITNNEGPNQEWDILANYFKTWEEDSHVTILDALKKRCDSSNVCCCSMERQFFCIISRQAFDTYFKSETYPWPASEFDLKPPTKVNGKFEDLHIAPPRKEKPPPREEKLTSVGVPEYPPPHFYPQVSFPSAFAISYNKPEQKCEAPVLLPEPRLDNRRISIRPVKRPSILSRPFTNPMRKSPITATAPTKLPDITPPPLVEVCDHVKRVMDTSREGSLPSPSSTTPPVDVSECSVLCQFPEGNDGVTISFRDMSRLPQGEMLNDTNIEFGIKYILHTKPTFGNSCYAYNTFFWAKLVKDCHSATFKNEETIQEWIKCNYPQVRRWTRKVDLFSKEHIVIPINDDLHWCILIIQNPKALLMDQNSPPHIPPNPCLYIMLDSIPDSDEKRNHGMQIIRDYLELEFLDKKLKTNPNLVFVPTNIKKVSHRYNPVQKNYIDCGVYLLAFFQQYVENQPEIDDEYVIDWIKYCPSFEITKVKYLREKMINFIKNHAGQERWSRLKIFEQQRCGVTNPSKESSVAAAKKTRSHSYCHADYIEQCKALDIRKQRERPERCRSLPARFHELVSTKPLILVTNGSGKISGKIH